MAIVGLPNVGKSTLLNALVGEPLSIISPKPQATRLPVVGIRTDSDSQLIFVDQPGFLDPKYLMQEAMVQSSSAWLKRADAILHLTPLSESIPDAVRTRLRDQLNSSVKEAIVFTKSDLSAGKIQTDAMERQGEDDRAAFTVSARTGEGLEDVLAWCKEQVPMGPLRHDPDSVSTQPERFFVSEFVREAAFANLGQELPYSLAAEVEEFREDRDPVYIRVTMYVERESQKGMVVGKGGRTIKALGAQARTRIEELLQRRVYLDLWVKVWQKWRSKPEALRRLGFTD